VRRSAPPNHEEQHQELLVYDIKYILGNQPTFPVYENSYGTKEEYQEGRFIKIEAGFMKKFEKTLLF
jgi:hypothetical protein